MMKARWSLTQITLLNVLFCVGMAGGVRAASYYVTPTGAGIADGVGWNTAFSNVQSAVNLATNSGDVIYLQYGNYTNKAEILISNAPGVIVRGGYAGEIGETPGATTNIPSLLTRGATTTNRIVNAVTSTVTVERVTIANGYLSEAMGAGAGLRLISCAATLTNCVVWNNVLNTVANSHVYGGGIYVKGGILNLTGCTLASNNMSNAAGGLTPPPVCYGAGLYCTGVVVTISSCVLLENYSLYASKAANYYRLGQGGGAYLWNGSADISNTVFQGNYCRMESSRRGETYGGALYADGVNPLSVQGSTFRQNYCRGDTTWPLGGASSAPIEKGGALYLTGSSLLAAIADCVLIENVGTKGSGDIRIAGGTVSFTNCLVARNAGDAVVVEGGTARLVNVTVADNWGWGVKQTGGALAVTNSIVWGNSSGGLTSSSATVGYTCVQETRTGDGNMVSNPLFVAGYYLAVSGLLAQAQSSPCVDHGGDNAGVFGMDTRTTQTDGSNDTTAVDLGYHYAGAFADSLSNLVLYVNAGGGDDANTGWTVGSPLKTITAGLAKAVPGSTINISAGLYNQTLGEMFPLTIPDENLSLVGTDAVNTVIDASGGTSRVVSATAKGSLLLQSLTIQGGGIVTNLIAEGAGLRLLGCDTTLDGCVIRSNSITYVNNATAVWPCSGSGVFADQGRLTIRGARVEANSMLRGSGSQYALLFGVGVCAQGLSLIVTGAVFQANRFLVTAGNYDHYAYGGGVYAEESGVSVVDSQFNNNSCSNAGTRWVRSYGGALYLNGCLGSRISGSGFSNNWCYVSAPSALRIQEGGAIYLTAFDLTTTNQTTAIERCAIYSNGWGIAGAVGNVYHALGTLGVTNSLIAQAQGAGMTATTGTVNIANCTFADNSEWGLTNGGAVLNVKNSIAWGNAAGGIYTNRNAVVIYSDAQETLVGDGNKNQNPLFKDSEGGNYRLDGPSPCINRGTNEAWMATSLDLAGQRRKMGGIVDMGAYESLSAGTVFVVH